MTTVAIIGVGNMGAHHARVFSSLKNVSLVSVSDLDEKKGKEIANLYKCKFYKDYKEMLKKEKIDAVSIVVPTAHHTSIAVECMKNGKHIIVEKPLADSVENAEKIISAAKENNVKLLVGHIERHNPAVKKLKEIIDAGKLGEIVSISAKRVGLYPPQVTDVNVVADLAIHDIDVLNYLAGHSPKKITAHLSKALNSKRADCAEILMEYNGKAGIIQVNWVTPVKIRQLSVTGTKGYAELDYITQKLVLFKSKYEKQFSTFGELIKFSKTKATEIHVKNEEPLKAELRHFVDCVQNKAEPLVSGKEGLEALKIALIINKGEAHAQE